jgi:hypothetical protein
MAEPNTFLEFLQTWVVEGVSQGISISILTILAILLEYKFGIVPKLIKLWHKILNSKAPVILNITYETDEDFKQDDFNQVKEIVKDVFRSEFNKIKIFKSKNTLEFNVNGMFNITIFDNKNQQISLLTSKLPTTMWSMKKDLRKLFSTLKIAKEKIINVAKEKKQIFKEKEFSIQIFLPYRNRYVKFYPPKGINIKEYDIKFNHDEFSSMIHLKGDVVNIYTDEQTHIDKLISKIV